MAQLNSDNRAMPYRNLGGTGLMVSALSFGTMTLSDTKPPVEGKISRGEEAYELIEKCYRGGVNLFGAHVAAPSLPPCPRPPTVPSCAFASFSTGRPPGTLQIRGQHV
eukprot:SAG25_NODE_3632_length_1017_cov_1.879085_1_plen_108_part_00